MFVDIVLENAFNSGTSEILIQKFEFHTVVQDSPIYVTKT